MPLRLRLAVTAWGRMNLRNRKYPRLDSVFLAARAVKSASIMREDMTDRRFSGSSETVLPLSPPCTLFKSPNSWWIFISADPQVLYRQEKDLPLFCRIRLQHRSMAPMYTE